ncbi:MAG: hypothetical protein AAGI03_10525 [Pseudomonadota bacterium]
MNKWIVGLAAAMATTGAASAQDSNIAIGAGVGTPGANVDVAFKVNDFLRVRGGGNLFQFDEDVDIDDITYEGELDLSGLSVAADLHPFSNSFMLTGGAYFGTKEIGVSASPNEAVTIGDTIFAPDEFGSLVGDVSFEDTAPFIGLGFDNTFTGSGNWGFRAVVGASLFGSADVSLDSVGGTLSNDPNLQAELEAEEAKIEEDVEDFELYPILQIGLTYRF